MKKIFLIIIIAILAMFSAFAETNWYVGATADTTPKAESADFSAGIFGSTSSRPITHGGLIYYTNGGVSVQFASYSEGSFKKIDSFILRGSSAIVAGLETGEGKSVGVRGGIGLSADAVTSFSESVPVFVSFLSACVDVESNIRLTDSSFLVLGAQAKVPFVMAYKFGDSDIKAAFADSLTYLLDGRIGFGLRF